MNTKTIATAFALGAMIASSFSPAPVSQNTDPEFLALKSEVEALTKKVEAFETFTTSQAAAGKTLEAALARAEAEGFTAGINPSSREALLGGLRAQAEAMQAGAEDEDAKKAPKAKGSMRGKRRPR